MYNYIFQNDRILNGEDVPAHKYPWLSLVEELDLNGTVVGTCTGSVISRYAVLTAAHCCGKYMFDHFFL